MRLNPNPRLEKLKDFRCNSDLTYRWFSFSPGTRHWACNYRERVLRREWRDNRWRLDEREDLTMTRFNHKHRAMWDLT
jgi:hypothetical protein